jgi:segregation and condensation protein B
MSAGNDGGRPVRRPLGLPGQPRAEEWLEPAFELLPEPVPEPVAAPVAAVGTEPRVVHQKSAPPASDVPGEPEEPAGPGLRAELEAVLMVVDEPVTEERLAGVLERPRAEVAAALRELSAEYEAAGRGFDLRPVAGGWRFYSRDSCARAVDRFLLDGQQARLTQAALETLAVVAYRQPVSRSRVSAVRGVNCDGVMRTLVQRGLVEEAGSEPETGAILYRTTNYFLERMGLRGLDELPELAPFLPEVDDVEAESLEGTMIAEAVASAAAQAADGSGEAGRAAPDR